MGNIYFVCFVISASIQIFYSVFFYLRLNFYKVKENNNRQQKAISVIIAAKNESINLANFLPKVLNQNYPNFEVIVVNDCSSDNSDEVLQQLQKSNEGLKVLTILATKTPHGKKFALSKGIEIAKNETLAFIDADCYPISENWLAKISNAYTKGIEIVLGYGGYEQEKGTLNKFIRYETIYTAMQYLGFANAGVPYMGVGRNLSYKKSLWEKEGGFAAHAHILSGDDDLFVNAVASKKNTAILLSPESKTISEPKKTISTFLKQKQRHLEAGGSYKVKHKVLLGIDYFTKIGFFIFALLGLLFSSETKIVLVIFLIRELFVLFAVYFSIKKFKEKSFMFLILTFEFLAPVISILIVFTNWIFKRKVKWQ